MSNDELLLQAFDDLSGAVAQPMELKLALEGRGVSTSNAAVMIEAAIESGILVPTGQGGLRLKDKS